MPLEAMAESCPECGGRGWIVVPDGGNGAARPCGCRERARVPRLLAAAGIPPRYQGCRLDNFKLHSAGPLRNQLLRAQAESRRYVDGFVEEGGRFRESGLIFIGPPGVGKTHLAVAVLVELVERWRVHGRFVEFTSLLHQIQSTFDPGSPESKRQILDPLAEAEVLVLDELGAQQPTPWVRDILYLLINGRYTRRLPTIFTTNYRLEPAPAAPAARPSLDRGADPERPAADGYGLLASRLSPMLVSRLCEMALPVDLSAASDFRQDVQMHRHRV